MWWFCKKPKVNIEALGVIPDPRSKVEKERDYKAEEIVRFVPFVWKEKPESEWHRYPIFHQDRSSSCLANTVAKVLGIENYLEENKFVHYSPRDIYTRRKNFPSKGMWFKDGFEIGYKFGASLEQLMPSMNKNENEMNKSDDRKSIDEQMALAGKGGNYLWIPINIDAIASIIEPLGKGVGLGVRFGPKEWSREVPKILGTETPYHHAITATNAILYKGKKALVIEDSWDSETGKEGRRIVTEDWFKARRISAALYFTALKNTWRDSDIKLIKPKYNFKQDLIWGSRSLEVEKLQEILQYEELFPQNTITTGYYGNISAKSILEFQKKYKVASLEELEKLQGRRVGPKTRSKLNQLYS